jgi:hypothetical protein
VASTLHLTNIINSCLRTNTSLNDEDLGFDNIDSDDDSSDCDDGGGDDDNGDSDDEDFGF